MPKTPKAAPKTPKAEPKAVEKVAKKVDEIDPFDGMSFQAFFSPAEWGDDFPELFDNLRSFRGFCNLPNLKSTDKGYTVTIEAEGLKKDDIKVELIGHESLVVTAQASAPSGGKDKKKKAAPDDQPVYSLWEEVAMPVDADVEKMSVKYDGKVITVQFPKVPEPKDGVKKPIVAKWKPDAKSAKLDEDVQKRMKHIQQLREELDAELQAVMDAEDKIEDARSKDRIAIAVQ